MSNLSSNGLSRVLTYLKTWITGLLNSKSDTSHTHSDYIPNSGTTSITGTGFFKSTSDSQLQIGSGTSTTTGGCFVAYGSEYSTSELAGAFRLRARTTTNYDLIGYADGSLTWGNKNVAIYENVIPRSLGSVMDNGELGCKNNTGTFAICSGTDSNHGGNIVLYGCAKGSDADKHRGAVALYALLSVDAYKCMFLSPNGTWTWDGTAVQLVSDQRLKQQISEIDDKLLDAWEDVLPCQFKYNEAVEQKGKDNARLHTGYVVQQIDEACKSHNLDISAYGLYCHEEYPQETEEVEIEQEDGTKVKETKVIREASEHYSLRYTETLVVECAYLRRENTRLKTHLASLENRLEQLEQSLK